MVSDDLAGLVHHSDWGSNYVSLISYGPDCCTRRPPLVGFKGDSYDDAMVGPRFALFKTGLSGKRRPWRTVEQVELVTLQWVWWFKNQRLHSENGNVPPLEIEQACSANQNSVLATARQANTWQPNPGFFSTFSHQNFSGCMSRHCCKSSEDHSCSG